jgi:hypothetical protein
MPIDSTKQYEEQLRKAIAQAQARIRDIYSKAIIDVTLRTNIISLKDKPFSLSLYPVLDKFIEGYVEVMYQDLYRNIVESVKKSWDLSNRKNDQFVDKRLAGRVPSGTAKQILYDPNLEARDAFIDRKEKGLDLSKRVWNSLSTFKKEMEQGLGIGIGKGQSAITLATEMQKYLNNPDKLFRRVRGEDGKLYLSKPARDFNPGQGVYRSSYQNAIRLTGTETNIAYRKADGQRWQGLPFVTGIEIKTSNNHPEYDICDQLAGNYPKDFIFTGWHPRCKCFQVPKMMSDAEYDKHEDAILSGEELPSVPGVEEPPAKFSNYVSDNADRIKGWSNKPYWVRDNHQFTKHPEMIHKT